MRVYVDIGWMQDRLDEPFLTALAALVQAGGPALDLRVALDGSDPGQAVALRNVLRCTMPSTAVSAYSLPAGLEARPEIMDIVVNRLRQSHAAALMPDVALTIRGIGAEGLPAGVPVVDWTPEDPGDLIGALRTACEDRPPDRPHGDEALAAIASMLRTSGMSTNVETLGNAFMRSSRLGTEAGEPRLLIDVSYTNRIDHGTGIQRVVRRISDQLQAIGSGRRFNSVALVAARQPDFGVLCQIDHNGAETDREMSLRTGDTFLLLDASWEECPHFAPRLNAVRHHGGRIVTVVYDILPLRYPEVVAIGLPPIFDRWFRTVVAASDALVCISRTVADDVVSYIRENGLPHRDGLRIGWWHLGADLPTSATDIVSDDVASMLGGNVPTFLMVGTVEPRKCHAVALSAMERIWAAGHNARLIILGREGWNVSELAQRLREHPEAHRRLFWQSKVSDADLAYAYQKSTALLFPSLAEGFGLPIIEAAHHGLGAIASDIPILREIGGDGVMYVPVDDAAGLSDAIERVLNGEVLDPSGLDVLSWQQSAQQLLKVLDDDLFEYVLRA